MTIFGGICSHRVIMSSKLTTGGLTFLKMASPGLAPQCTFCEAASAQDLRPNPKLLQSPGYQQEVWVGLGRCLSRESAYL